MHFQNLQRKHTSDNLLQTFSVGIVDVLKLIQTVKDLETDFTERKKSCKHTGVTVTNG